MCENSDPILLQSNPAFWLDNLASRIERNVREIEAPFDFSWREFEMLSKIGAGERGLPLNHVVAPDPLGGVDDRQGEILYQRMNEAGFVETEHEPDGLVRVRLTEDGQSYVRTRQKAYSELADSLEEVTSKHFLEDLKAASKALLMRGDFR